MTSNPARAMAVRRRAGGDSVGVAGTKTEGNSAGIFAQQRQRPACHTAGRFLGTTAMSRILVTGAAGFIGAHVAAALARDGHAVTGCDSFNAYYDPRLKVDRVAALLRPHGVACTALDLAQPGTAAELIQPGRFDAVIHLAAQAGVRHSIDAPMDYVQSNLVGFVALLEACRQAGVGQVLYASSSSVYGSRSSTPFSEDDRVDQPASLYAATKKANEAIAHAYAHVHGLPLTGLRFFTVYGPWGRPDMAYFSFARRMRRGEPITLFAGGELLRDFTFIDDAVEAVTRLLARGPAPRVDGGAPAEVFNIGHRTPVKVTEFVASLERATGLAARIEHAPMQPGDVPVTCADPAHLQAAIGDWTWTPLDDGLRHFAQWLQHWEP
jgi:UDP-glucuronate 4-epimerase